MCFCLRIYQVQTCLLVCLMYGVLLWASVPCWRVVRALDSVLAYVPLVRSASWYPWLSTSKSTPNPPRSFAMIERGRITWQSNSAWHFKPIQKKIFCVFRWNKTHSCWVESESKQSEWRGSLTIAKKKQRPLSRKQARGYRQARTARPGATGNTVGEISWAFNLFFL